MAINYGKGKNDSDYDLKEIAKGFLITLFVKALLSPVALMYIKWKLNPFEFSQSVLLPSSPFSSNR